ncbi:cilia- and flagella-associated protein 157-like [Pempheris klunzingeri]|uniref:cilia- and flagella-associated protein 157-like n=1 Tax=Pempheris klunzingeri TaxID=3127111 RepID=UPI00397FF32E
MAAKISPDDKETSLYLIQIRYLDEQLERCQLRCDELERQNEDLAAQYSALEKDKTDIVEYLKHSVAAKEVKLDELAERLESQQQAAEQETEDLQLQHSQYMQELQERVDELSSERGVHEAKFEEQNKHLVNVMQQVSHIESLKKQLVSEKGEHYAVVYRLNQEAWFEEGRIIEEEGKSLEDGVMAKVSSTVCEERAEHKKQAEQLQVLLKESLALRKEKDRLQNRMGSLCSELELLKKNLDKSAKVRFTLNKDVMQLMKRCKRLEVKHQGCSAVHENMLADEEAVRQRLASMSEACCQKAAESAQVKADIRRERRRRRQLEGGMLEAVMILRHILTDLEKAPETHWTRLLEILESTAPRGPEKSSQGQTSDPKPARAETLNFSTDPLFLMARYRPGDLGFVPQPTWQHKPAASRTGPRLTSTQLHSNRNLCSQKKSSSDDPSAAAPLPRKMNVSK